jgi:hypothetical protein
MVVTNMSQENKRAAGQVSYNLESTFSCAVVKPRVSQLDSIPSFSLGWKALLHGPSQLHKSRI